MTKNFLNYFESCFSSIAVALPLSWNTEVMCQSFRAISLVGAIGRGGKVEVNPTFKCERSKINNANTTAAPLRVEKSA